MISKVEAHTEVVPIMTVIWEMLIVVPLSVEAATDVSMFQILQMHKIYVLVYIYFLKLFS